MRSTASGLAFSVPFFLLLGFASAPLAAQPAGGQVVAGGATITASGGSVTIAQTSARAIINWQDFSLAAGERARFVQPDATSATLNRVVSGLPSSLLGTLEANGRVFLINPNGILIGAGARIDAAGFLASTLDVANHEFLAGGDLRFGGTSTAAIQNLGAINALGGDVFLIARQVENSGAIAATNRTVGLAAGSEILLTTGGEQRLFVQAGSLPGAIVNGGTIAAATAELKAAGGNAYALAINNSGVVRATGSAIRDGKVWLVASGDGAVGSSGTLVAGSGDGARGGEVHVLGERVTLDVGTVIDVSGARAGGTALIGGDFQGKNSAVRNAQTTTVVAGALIKADATIDGDGGKIVVWSDGATRFAGAISARGGATSGNGGMAEVSGKGFLDFRGGVDLTAGQGRNGSLLLDPTNLTIGATADVNGDATTGDDVTGNIAATDFSGATSLITATQVATLLGTADLSLAATNNITVSSAVSWNSAFGLTLSAGNAIAVNAAVTKSGTGAVAFTAGSGGITLGANISAPTVTLNSANGITVNQNVSTGGVTTLNADSDNNGTGTFTVANNRTLTTGDAALNITAADVAIVFFGTLNSGTAATTITASAGRTIGLGGTAGELTLTNNELAQITAGGLSLNTTGVTGDATINGIGFGGTIATGPVILNTGGTATFATANSVFFSGITINAKDGIAVGADITAMQGNLMLDGDADSVASPGDGIVFTGTRSLTASTDSSVIDDPAQGRIVLRNGAVGTNGTIASAALNLSALNTLTILDDVTATGGNFAANVNLDGQTVLSTGVFTLASGKTIATATSGNIDIAAVDVVLDGSLNSVGSASITGSFNVFVRLGSVLPTDGLKLSDAEFGRITATSLTIGLDTRGNGEIRAGNLTAANTDQFGPLTFTEPAFSGVTFEGTSVVGNRLTVTGPVSIVFMGGSSLATSTAVDADPDLSLSATDTIVFNTDVAVTSGGTGTLTLNAANTFTSHGGLTLEAGDNLALDRELSVPGFLTLNADKNNDGTGTLTIADGIVIVGQQINITAADLTLTGTATLFSTLFDTNITASAGRSIGLGATVVAGGLNLAGSKLQQITANGLTMTSSGNILVDGITAPNSNNIAGMTTLTGNGGASAVTFANNASTFNALTVNSTTTIANNALLTLDVGNLALLAGGNITQTAAIEIGTGIATLGGATITLAHADNTFGAVTVNSGAGNVSLREDAAISLAGITRTSGGVTLNAATDLTQTGVIAIGTGAANLTASNLTLDLANILGAVTINAGTGNVVLTEADAIAVASIAHTGTLNLSADGAITDTGTLTISGATTLAAGATNDIVLDSANDFSTVVVTSGKNVTLNDLNALALGNVTAANSFLATATGNLTINAGASIAATGAVATPLVLVAGGNFVNTPGATALDAGTGRWLVYSTSPAGSTENGLTAAAGSTSPRLYNRTFAANAPATIVAGNHLIYSSQPTLTVTANNQTRAYGDANAFTATTTGFLTDDGVTDTLANAVLTGAASLTSLGTASSSVSGSPFAITLATGTLASGAGYGFAFVDGVLTITPRAVTVTADALQTKVYGNADPASFTFTTTSLGSGSALSGSLTRAAGETVTGGPYAITQGTLTNANNGNYSLTYVGATFAITPATLTYVATAADRFVGASDPAFSGTVTGFVAGDVQGTATTGTLSFATTATNVSPTGNYPINGSGLAASNGNYFFVQAAANATAFTIAPPPPQAPLTITAENKSKIYGAALPNFTATFAGFINGDTAANVTGLQFSTTATISSNVGTFTITPFGATAPASYIIGYVPGTLTINPATLTYMANAATRFFGMSNPAFSGTVTGFVAGESQGTATTGAASFSTTATPASPAGTYPINGSGLVANNGNYLFVQAPANATAFVIGAQVPLTITADDKSKIYGAALPAFTGRFAGFINGDTSASVTGLQFSTTATMSSNVGTFTITPFGATAPPSYIVGYLPGTLTISPAALTLTANNATRSYGAANPAFGATFTGLVNGDASTVLTGLRLDTSATMASGVGAYSITPSAASAANYALTFVPGTLTISRASLTLTADNAARIYGAANPSFTGNYSGFVNGDTSTVVSGLQFSTSATAASGIGNYVITPAGATAANYSLTFVPGTLTINRASLTLTATNAEREFGAANPAFTATFGGFVNGDTAAAVSGLVFNTSATAASAVGEYSITLSGASAANYSIVFVDGILRVTTPTVTEGDISLPVVTIGQIPAITSDFAVVRNGDRLVFVSVDLTGDRVGGGTGTSNSIDEELTLTLSDTTDLPAFENQTLLMETDGGGGATSTNRPNFGSFELAGSSNIGVGGGSSGGGLGGLGSAQLNDPGLFRESTVSMGGFNVVYHERVADAREQTESNTALGSSYREFADSDNPQVNLVRAKLERKPAEASNAGNAGGAL